MDNDTLKECKRYDKRAKLALAKTNNLIPCGYDNFPQPLQAPYKKYYNHIRSHASHTSVVLELGAGDGQHSLVAAECAKSFIATDISPTSLELLENRLLKQGVEVETKVSDMSDLPFDDSSVDMIISAGSLSYAEPIKVDAEVIRVLKPTGCFICVDSLNHNPIYRMNRFAHHLRGHRTKSTLNRMPTTQRIRQVSDQYSSCEVEYFGTISFASPVIQRVLGRKLTTKISSIFDRFSILNRWAFKFVLCATKPIKNNE